jgi:ubiquinone/menaquinone biosynthesis C-methylase UbiE
MKEYRLPLSSFLKRGFGFYRTRQTFEQIRSHIYGRRIIDIGCGTGHLSKILQDHEYDVLAIDVRNRVQVEGIQFSLYDGKKIPVHDLSYDTSLLMTVLHHTPDPEAVIKEALRVSRRVVIIEDVYESASEKIKTFVLDSVFNLEFFGHPHSNKTDAEWKEYFASEDIRLLSEDHWITRTPIGSVRQALYCIELHD